MFSSRIHNDLSVLMIVLVLMGCVTTPPAYRINPDWTEKKKSIRTIEILPGKIEVYQISAGGGREKMDEWSSDAKNNVVSAITKQLQEDHKLAVKIFREDGMPKETAANLKETRALFEVVNSSIIAYTYGGPDRPAAFPEKIANFDYSLGKEIKDLNTEHADAILMVWGIDYALTAGASAQQFVGALLGVPFQRPTYMSMALIDSNTGSILWYRYLSTGYDLTDADSAGDEVERFLEDFPDESGHGVAK